MKALWRIVVVASAGFLAAGTPVLAQEAPAPAQNEVIGNPQLRDFSINGTVTRPADTPVQVPSQPRPTTNSPSADQAQTPASRPAQPSREASASSRRTETAAREQPARSESIADLPPPTPARRIATPSLAQNESTDLSPQPAFLPASDNPNLGSSRNELPMLPWLIAALAFAGAAAWYFLRQRPRESYAGAGTLSRFDAPSPAPPPARAPPPAAVPQPSGGVVSTRLRPWLEIEFTPQRGVLDEEKAAIAFELSVFNSGSAPARDVLLEAAMFNAGALQDRQIGMFFDNPVATGDRIPTIPPMRRITVNSAVFLPREQVQPIEMEGRQLLVPLIAINALYRWTGGEGQSSVSYLVGTKTKTDKLGPFRLDLGPRIFRNLDAREHELRVRK